MSVTIYMLENSEGLRYIGSTINLQRRLYEHNNQRDECMSLYLYNGEPVTNTILETCTEDVRKERETYWIKNTENVVNARTPEKDIQREKEYKKSYQKAHPEKYNNTPIDKEARKARNKAYYEKNRQKIIEQVRAYRESKRIY